MLTADKRKQLENRKRNTTSFINGVYTGIGRKDEHNFYKVKDPSNNFEIEKVYSVDRQDAEFAIYTAKNAFDHGPWPRMAAKERAVILRRMGELVRENAEWLGFLEAWSIGKLFKASVNHEIPRAADNLSEFADALEHWQDNEWIKENISYLGKKVSIKSIAKRQPLGVGGVIIPGSAPIMHSTWKFAPCIAAGNTCVLKPPLEGALGVLQLGEIANEAGLPPGVLNIIAGGADAGDAMVRNPLINRISFTGGDETGRKVNIANAEVGRLLGPLLELGGKAPQIVFADVDIERAAKGVAQSIFRSAGQSCVAGSRLLVEDKKYVTFLAALVEYVRTMRIGNQFEQETDIGPLTTEKHIKKVETDVKMALIENPYAKVVTGGSRVWSDGIEAGNFLEPTIIVNVSPAMKIWQDEVFGPVLVVMTFKTEEEAIALANESRYGLSSNVWTEDKERAMRVAERIDAGMTWINSHFLRDLHAPFGGRKASGNCAESLSESLYAWTQHKMICTPV